ncbi:MAG: hypothetical protein AB1513_11110 [Pseudomonadota bacterium]
MKRALIHLSWLMLLAGCHAVQMPFQARPGETLQSAAGEEIPDDSETVAMLLAYFDTARKMSPPELARASERTRQAYTRENSTLLRLQLALLLSMPQNPQRDDARVLALLEPQLKDSGSLHNFAMLLHAHVAEHKRLNESAEALDAKTREEQKRADILQQKLDALITLERSLIQRDTTKSNK